jgi:hypothetical protein
MRTSVASLIVFLCLLPAFISQCGSIIRMLNTLSNGANSMLYLGIPRQFGIELVSFFLGSVSLHNIPPYFQTTKLIVVMQWGVIIVAAVIFFTSLRRGHAMWGTLKKFSILYVAVFLIYMILGKNYEYTQYKAFSYILPFTLFVLCAWCLNNGLRLIVMMLLWGLAMAILHTVFTVDIVNGGNR